MSKKTIHTAKQYQLVIEGELLDLFREALELEQAVCDSEPFSNRRANLEEKLYHLYEDIGWSVVYDFNTLPF